MKLEQSFRVEAGIERVWQALIDVERVAPCLPGAAITARNEDGSYNGTFKIKIGPTSAQYAGRLEMTDVQETAHTATMLANGTDKRGHGGAKAKIVSRVQDGGDGGTLVHVDTDYHITGRLARFGRGGMIEDISERLLREFAGRLQAMLAEDQVTSPPDTARVATAPDVTGVPDPEPAAGPPPPKPNEAAAEDSSLQGLSLIGGVLAGRLRRPPVLVAVVLLLVLLLRRLRR